MSKINHLLLLYLKKTVILQFFLDKTLMFNFFRCKIILEEILWKLKEITI